VEAKKPDLEEKNFHSEEKATGTGRKSYQEW